MPERISTRTFNSEAVQGEGSWVKLRAATVGEILSGQREAEIRDNLWYKLGVLLGRLFRKRPSESALTRAYLRRSIQHVRDWNWVDDQGDPLPLPSVDLSVLERLTQDEIHFLIACVRGELKTEEQKN